MVRMKALKTFRPVDAKVGVHPGDEYDAKEGVAAQHERAGMAIRVGKAVKAKAPEVKSATAPLSRAGGQDGAGGSSSSSRPARARSKRKASSRKRTRG